MKHADIKVGRTYSNGANACHRLVVSIEGDDVVFEIVDSFRTITPQHNKMIQRKGHLANKLDSFAKWAKVEVE